VEINPFEMAKKQVDLVAKELNLDPNIVVSLKRVERSLIVSIPVIMDNGSIEDVRKEVKEVVDRELEHINEFCMELAEGKVPVA